jgi:signal transduction histidine kinase
VVIGSLIFKKELSYRLSNIRITTRQISAGHLSKRISTSVNDDEFIALNSDINMMLDRIELLMKSARHISDTIAHNIRTPLTRITGRLRMAQRADASQSDLLKANQDAIDGIENLNFLLEKILQIAELEGGIQRRTFKPCQLSVIVSDVLDMHEAFAEDKNIELIKNEMPDITIYGDVNLLASAIANLTSNAIKFASTTVTVDILKKEDTAEIIIQDDGPGVPAAELDNLGRHFYRLDPSQEGHGLGLTSAKSIIKLHRGSLSFFDAQPGLKVVISLPLG